MFTLVLDFFVFRLVMMLHPFLNFLFNVHVCNTTLLLKIAVDIFAQSWQKLIYWAGCRLSVTKICIFSIVFNFYVIAESLVVLVNFYQKTGGKIWCAHAIQGSGSFVVPFVSETPYWCEIQDSLKLNQVFGMTWEQSQLFFCLSLLYLVESLNDEPQQRSRQSLTEITSFQQNPVVIADESQTFQVIVIELRR